MRRFYTAAMLFLCIVVPLWGQTLSQDQIREVYHRSFAYEQAENYTDAISAMSEVYQAYPQGYTVNLRLGWLYYMNGNFANAAAHYDAAINVAPYALEAKSGKLLPLLAQQKYEAAETLAYQIVTADFYNYYGNLRLAYALRMQGKNEQAMTLVSKMLIIYPTDTLYLTEIGLLQQALGEDERAAAVFSDLLILDPENVTAKAFFQEK